MTHRYDPESGMNTSGLNGKGRYVADVANHALLVLASRIFAVIGLPVAGFIFWSIQSDISSIESVARGNLQLINNMSSATAIHDTRLTYQDNALNDHNIRIRVLETRTAAQE